MKRMINFVTERNIAAAHIIVIAAALAAFDAKEDVLYTDSSVTPVSCYKDACNKIGGPYASDNTRKYRKEYYACPENHNYTNHSRIHKECKPVKTLAPHKATVNNIY